MKSAGSREVHAALLRVRKLAAMERVEPADAKFIEEGLERVLGRIESMTEINEDGFEEVPNYGKTRNR